MSIPEAIRGARAELASISSPIERLKRISIYCRIIAAELVGTLRILPYGIRAHTLYRSLPEPTDPIQTPTISVVKDQHYSPNPLPRNTLDIYIPPRSNQTNPLPVCLFCHGGVWATGEKWHYAPFAARLAQAGVVTAVMSYTLYPKKLAPEMATEVSQALDWVFDNIDRYGGDVNRIHLVGHSAGAHLCAMALLNRILSSQQRQQRAKKDAVAAMTIKMPRKFIGMAGCYDIAQHFEYERSRNVHILSTMARAVGGERSFAANSPTVILRNAVRAGGDPLARHDDCMRQHEGVQRQWRLHGESISARIGFLRGTPTHDLAPTIHRRLQIKVQDYHIRYNKNSTRHNNNGNNNNESDVGEAEEQVMPIALEALQAHFPPTVLQASTTDKTVPWYESSDFHWALRDCGIASSCLVYGNNVGHGDFVVNWRPRAMHHKVAQFAREHSMNTKNGIINGYDDEMFDLAPYASDFIRIVANSCD